MWLAPSWPRESTNGEDDHWKHKRLRMRYISWCWVWVGWIIFLYRNLPACKSNERYTKHKIMWVYLSKAYLKWCYILHESGDFALAKSPLSPNPMLKEGLAHHKEWISDHQFNDLLSLVWYNVGCSCQLVFYSVHLKHLPAFTRLAFYNIYCLYRLTDEPTD